MIVSILKKCAYALLILWSVVTVVFILFSFSFPDPANMSVGQRTDLKTQEAIKKEFGLDQSIFRQYLLFINDISPLSFHKGDRQNLKEKYTPILCLGGNTKLLIKAPHLRYSFQSRQRTSTIILSSFKGTMLLAFASIILAGILGIVLGILASLKVNSWLDQFLVFISTIGISVPSFFSAIIISWLLGFVLSEYTGLSMTGSWMDLDPFEGRVIKWKNLIAPAFALAIRPLSIFTLLTRSSMLDTLNKDYIRTARSKGLTEYQIIKNHALKNALNPVITSVSGWFASLLAGAFFIEYIFNWKGLGKVTIDALENSDIPIVMGSILLVATLFLAINMLVDLLYSLLDPRVKIDS